MLKPAVGETQTYLNQNSFTSVSFPEGTMYPLSFAMVADQHIVIEPENYKPITMVTDGIDETYIDETLPGQDRHSESYLAASINLNECFSNEVHVKPENCPTDIPETFYESEPTRGVAGLRRPVNGPGQVEYGHITRPCSE